MHTYGRRSLAVVCLTLTACTADASPDAAAASGAPLHAGESSARLIADTMHGPGIADSVRFASGTATDPWFAAIVRLWENERYGEAFDELLRYRNERTYARNEIVDYMIATSACRIGKPELGRRLFESILYHYALDDASEALVRRELERCPPAAGLRPIAIAASGSGPVTSGTRGKLQYVLNRADGEREVPLANQPVTVLREIPAGEFARRLHPPQQRDSAIAAVRALLAKPGGYSVHSRGGFVVASRHHDAAAAYYIADALTQYLDFFRSAFDMPAPTHLITVYLASDADELRSIAEHVHGIGVADQSIGYSFRNDLSMVGIIPGRSYGTLAHELFHLMVRQDFGDLPPWLDEGYAALYEVSRMDGDGTIEGLENWRGEVLRTFWNLRPPLDDLLRADWRAFEAEGYDVEVQAATHATARYFALFLQQRGALGDVYTSFRDRPLLELTAGPGEDGVRRIETLLGSSIDDIDTEFTAWFETLRD